MGVPRTARKLGVALPIFEATKAEELDVAFASAVAQHCDAIVDLGDGLTVVEAPRVIALAAKYHLPATTCSDNLPTVGWSSTAPISPISFVMRAIASIRYSKEPSPPISRYSSRPSSS